MQPIERVIREHDWFVRRRDLIGLGYTDADLRSALARKRIFRVRHGWYSIPTAPEAAVRAVRVGGRLTGASALESYGLPVPRPSTLHVEVAATASRLRSPDDRRRRLPIASGVTAHWVARRRGASPWRVPVADALALIVRTEPRDVAVACLSAALAKRAITITRLREVCARGPLRARSWAALASRLDESHGETYARLRMRDAGIEATQQVHVPGVGRLDFRLGSRTWLEIDGGQHDPGWTGAGTSSWLRDRERDLAMAVLGHRVLRVSYPQLSGDWPTVVAAIRRALADDEVIEARRARHPYRPPPKRKRRRSATIPLESRPIGT